MSDDLDLEAYLARIGYGGPRGVGHATLAGLLAAHMNAVAFENIDVLLGRPIRLDLRSLQEKIVGRRRGGYCFEQATLFLAALRGLGFEASAHTARVVLTVGEDEAPRSHMWLCVRLAEGAFAADPGLGGVGCRAPIPLDGTPVRDGDEVYRLETDGRRQVLVIETAGGRRAAWIAGFDRDNWIDFEVANHWVATYPASPFINRLMMRAMIPGGRATLMNRDAVVRSDGETRRFQIADRAALRAFVRAYCGFDCAGLEGVRVPTVGEWG